MTNKHNGVDITRKDPAAITKTVLESGETIIEYNIDGICRMIERKGFETDCPYAIDGFFDSLRERLIRRGRVFHDEL